MQINPMDFLKNAKKWQDEMGSLQQKLEGMAVTGRAGGGMVEIDMNGRLEVTAVRIEPGLIKLENREMLQDLIQSASLDALHKTRDELSSEMGSLVSGISSAMAKEPPSK
jgi:DNA-binding YbaB/EbfC family protein